MDDHNRDAAWMALEIRQADYDRRYINQPESEAGVTTHDEPAFVFGHDNEA